MTARRWVGLVLVTVAAVAPRLFLLDIPFERDEGAYAYVADTIGRGGLPYRDAFDHKPPGIYYLYALALELFGHSTVAPRLAAALAVAASCILIYRLVTRLGGRPAGGYLAIGLFALASLSPAYSGFTANTEIFTLPLVLGGCLLVTRPSRRLLLAAGLLFGVAFLLKQVVAIVAAGALLCALARRRREPRAIAADALLFTAAAAAPFALVALYFLARGALGDLWAGFFTYGFAYRETVGWRAALVLLERRAVAIRSQDPVTWVAGAAGLAFFLRRSSDRWERAFLCVLLLASFGGAALGGNFYGHYFVSMLPFVAIAAGVGTVGIERRRPAALAATVAALLVATSATLHLPVLALSDAELLERTYRRSPFLQSVGVGRFLAERAPAGARVLVIGSEAQILFYSGLEAASRVFYFYPLVMPTPLRDGFRREVASAFDARPPEYLVRVDDPSSHYLPYFADDPWVRDLLSRFDGYRLVGLSRYGSLEVATGRPPEPGQARTFPPGSIAIYQRAGEARPPLPRP